LVFPVGAAITAERLDAIAEARRNVVEEVALRRGNHLRIRELTVPEIEDVGVAPVPHGYLVVVEAEELDRVEREVGTLILREEQRQRARESKDRRRVLSARGRLGVPASPGHVIDRGVRDAAPHENAAPVRGLPIEG